MSDVTVTTESGNMDEWHPRGFARLIRNLDWREERDEIHLTARREVIREEGDLATPEAVKMERERVREQELERWKQRREILRRRAGLAL